MIEKKLDEKSYGAFYNSNLYEQSKPVYIKSTVIGTLKEQVQSGNWKKWKFLNRLNGPSNYIYAVRHPIFIEIKRLMSGLYLDNNESFFRGVLHNAEKAYEQFPVGTKLRRPEIIAPIALYISCKRAFIFVRNKDLFKLMRCEKVHFNRGLSELLRKNKKLFFELRSDRFRKTYLNMLLMGVKNHFDYTPEFLVLSRRLLEEYYEIFKNRKDAVIALFICVLVREKMEGRLKETNNQVSNFLGVVGSVINGNKVLLNYTRHYKNGGRVV